MGEFLAFVCKRTGKIYYQTDFPDAAEMNDELPDDINDEEKYVALPDKRELGLGKPLVLDFARQFLPDDFDDVRYFFSRRGRLPEIQGPARQTKCDRSLARLRSESHGADVARLVRAAFDRNCRLNWRAGADEDGRHCLVVAP